MKKLVVYVLICVSLIILEGTVYAATEGTINTETARIRSEASTNSTIIELASLDEKVEVIEESGDWYKVKYKDVTGYISKNLVDVEANVPQEQQQENSNEAQEQQQENSNEAQEQQQENSNEAQEQQQENSNEAQEQQQETAKTVDVKEKYIGNLGSEITIKILPTINSADIAKIAGGTQITVLEVINDWCYVQTETELGWVRTQILSIALSVEQETQEPEQQEPVEEEKTQEQEQEKEPEQTPEPTTTIQNKKGYVNVDSVNIRREASTSSDILDAITKNTEVTVVGEEEDWYKVQVNGITGYISSKYISDEKVPEVSSRASDAAREIEKKQEEKVQEPTTSEQPTTSSSSTTGSQVVAYAKQYLGYKYVSGGSTPSTGFDCSGFTSYVYKNFGVSLSRTSAGQKSNGTRVAKSDLQPGDLVIFNNDANTKVGHVGIYIGGNQFIHASNPSDGVKITSMSDSYYSKRYVESRRVL